MGDGPSRQDLLTTDLEALRVLLRSARRDLAPDTINRLTTASDELVAMRVELQLARTALAPTAVDGVLRRTS
jgi:hypothetical protein